MHHPQISSGFSTSRIRGRRWRLTVRCSRVYVGCRLMRWFGAGPRCVTVNMYREYPAVIRVPSPVRIIDHWDQLKMEEIIINSPIRFGRGGSARLARLTASHQIAARGKIICNPRASKSIRL